MNLEYGEKISNPSKKQKSQVKSQKDSLSYHPIAIQKKDFQFVDLHNKSNSVIQRAVIPTGNGGRILYDDSELTEAGKIAEVPSDPANYVRIYQPDKLAPKVEPLVHDNIINSKDYLHFMAKESYFEGTKPIEDEVYLETDIGFKNNDVTRKYKEIQVDIRKKYWKIHYSNYRKILQFFSLMKSMKPKEALGRLNNLNLWKVAYEFKETEAGPEIEELNIDICTVHEMVNQYIGSDTYRAIVDIFQNKDMQKEDIEFCYKEIKRRKEEMQIECDFCKEESEMENPGYGTLQFFPSFGLFGTDCGRFAGISAKYITDGTKESRKNYNDRYKNVPGYNFHAFSFITMPNTNLNGRVTAETCAAQGGDFRVVFDIRPTKENGSGLSIADDVQSITDSANRIHKNPNIKTKFN